jgi:hypothetical protein
MRGLAFSLLLLSATAMAQPQGPAPAQGAPGRVEAVAANPQRSGRLPEKRIERLSVQDQSASIEELRVGGESQSVVVQPKGDMPAYELQPTDGARTRLNERGVRGDPTHRRVWNVLRF